MRISDWSSDVGSSDLHDGHDTTNFSSTILDRTLQNPLGFHLLDLGDRLGGVQSLGADVCAIHDRVAAIEAERIFEIVEPLTGHLVATVGEPEIGRAHV